ncbi:MAG: hypothetical protein ACM3KD_06550 [Hyphomicrobiaceae bacterium]
MGGGRNTKKQREAVIARPLAYRANVRFSAKSHPSAALWLAEFQFVVIAQRKIYAIEEN